MKLPTCTLCGRPIKPDEPAFHRNGRPAIHRRHYGGDRFDEAYSRPRLDYFAGLSSQKKADLDAIERRWSPGAKRRKRPQP